MNKFYRTILLFLIISGVPAFAFAAEISFDAKTNQFSVGEEFIIYVKLDTGEESVNAVEGSVNFPSDLAEIKEIRDGNSIINFWLEGPKESDEGAVKFAGITPGGFSGSGNDLFEIVLKATSVGTGAIYAENARTFENDGVGTTIQIKNKSFPIVIKEVAIPSPTDIQIKDQELPESFTPMIGNDPDIYNGKYFLVFATEDKGSGIDYYKVKEGKIGIYVKAQSPYLLSNQDLNQNIYVKAVDKEGNERIEILPAKNERKPLDRKYIFVILIIVTLILLSKKIWKKHIK